ncbi:MAG: glutamate formimidoyltransferase [Thermoplasmata archaeon]|nr:glutamate formimidoyltransferase [Thermoplasmata archaeon]
MSGLFECVPNFSEGRDPAVIRAIGDAALGVPGVTLLDVESNADHHRSVMSLVGPGAPLVESVFRMMRAAVERIDLTHHRGEHPRMGAVDVVPFVPLGESTTEEAVALAGQLAERVWRELRLPVYLYGDAARRPERRDLAAVRKGQFEGIRAEISTDPARQPDVGDPMVHPTAGIVAIGARPVLIAYNAYLDTPDVTVAKKVAHTIRARDGGLAEVKALGFDIQERHQAQVSMNLTDYRKTPIHRALELIRKEAARYGAAVTDTEVVGLVPEDALFDAAEFYLQLNSFDRTAVLERKVRAAALGGPVPPPRGGALRSASLVDFSEKLAARTPTPGGGSASAAAAAFGAALGEMVVAYSNPADSPSEALSSAGRFLTEARLRLLEAVDADTTAYERLRAARRALKATPDASPAAAEYRAAIREATEVPLTTARWARDAADRLEAIRGSIKATISSDLVTGIALLRAAQQGAVANVRINLDDLAKSGQPTDAIAEQVRALSGSS